MKPVTVADIQFTPELSEKAISLAMALFRLRQAQNMYAEVNPAWEVLTALYYNRALANDRGGTEQEQCIMQGIRLAIWQSGQIPAPWSKAFPLPYVKPHTPSLPIRWRDRLVNWYKQIRDSCRRLKNRFNDHV